ncbi:hypothetical protein FACS189413_02790 [Bacteroidia bacterium]|nr:hypothetical protein FACS189413_02790 [Bacteroidia bacterium]
MEKKKMGFYPGCSLEGTAKEYTESVVALAQLFDIDLEQVPDWNCCGATAAHNLNKALSLALPARILAQARKAGMIDLIVPCAACYNRLKVVQHELFADFNLKSEVEQIVGLSIDEPLRIFNVLQFIDAHIVPGIPNKIQQKLERKAACYYGCLLVRPYDVLKFDRPEDPQSMDEIMRAIGSEPIDWPFKTECCGAGLSVSRTSLVGKLSGKIVKEAVDRGAEMLIVACPMCHANLDMRRSAIDTFLRTKTDIPVLYITQAIGMACGLTQKQLGTQRHLVKVDWASLTKQIETN